MRKISASGSSGYRCAINLAGRHGPAVEVSLHLATALRAHLIQLLLGFDAFRRRRHAEALAKPGDCANDCDGVGSFGKVPNEALIDLDFIERETAQIA